MFINRYENVANLKKFLSDCFGLNITFVVMNNLKTLMFDLRLGFSVQNEIFDPTEAKFVYIYVRIFIYV